MEFSHSSFPRPFHWRSIWNEVWFFRQAIDPYTCLRTTGRTSEEGWSDIIIRFNLENCVSFESWKVIHYLFNSRTIVPWTCSRQWLFCIIDVILLSLPQGTMLHSSASFFTWPGGHVCPRLRLLLQPSRDLCPGPQVTEQVPHSPQFTRRRFQ